MPIHGWNASNGPVIWRGFYHVYPNGVGSTPIVGAYKFSVALACKGVDSNSRGESTPIEVGVGYYSLNPLNNPVRIS